MLAPIVIARFQKKQVFGCKTKLKQVTTIKLQKQNYAVSAVYDVRRVSNKKLFIAPYQEITDDWMNFNGERLGLDIDLNYTLNMTHKLTPTNDAFKNLHVRHLMMHAKGTADKNKALKIERDDVSTHKIYFVPPTVNNNFVLPEGASTVPDPTFRKIGRTLADHIGEAPNIFVNDVAIGSHRLGESKIRTITNDAAQSLYITHLLPPQPKTKASLFLPYLTVFSSNDIQLDNASHGFKSNSYSIINLDRAIILNVGTASNTALKYALQCAASARLLQQDIPSLVLNAHIVSGSNGKAAIVFDSNNGLVDGLLNSKSVVAFNGAILNCHGLFPMYDGVTHSNASVKTDRGDLIETIKGTKTSTITQRLKQRPVEFTPTTVVFVVRDASLPAISKLSVADAAAFFASGGPSKQPFFANYPVAQKPDQMKQVFSQLCTEQNITAYVANIRNKEGGDKSIAEVEKIIQSAIEGTLKA